MLRMVQSGRAFCGMVYQAGNTLANWKIGVDNGGIMWYLFKIGKWYTYNNMKELVMPIQSSRRDKLDASRRRLGVLLTELENDDTDIDTIREDIKDMILSVGAEREDTASDPAEPGFDQPTDKMLIAEIGAIFLGKMRNAESVSDALMAARVVLAIRNIDVILAGI